jgi:hypothetical protein
MTLSGNDRKIWLGAALSVCALLLAGFALAEKREAPHDRSPLPAGRAGSVLAGGGNESSLTVAGAPVGVRTIGNCDTGGPIEIESTGGTTSPTAYATLKLAFDAINAGTHTGAINVEVCGDTAETATAALNASGGTASYTSVTVAPVGAPRVITGSIVGAIIKLNGADNVTIDGRIAGAGRNLTVTNSSTAGSTAAIWLSSLGVGAGATNNTIRNLELACGAAQDSLTVSTFGIVMSGATISTSSGGDDNDNDSFIANRIIRCRYGIVTRGQTTNNNLNPVVTDNIVGPTAFGPDEIGKTGILMQADTGAQVSRNTVQFVGGCLIGQTCTSGADRIGIGIGSESWSSSAPGTITSGQYTVTRNAIHDVVEERTYSAGGLLLSTTRSGSATNNLVANNFIYNIRSDGTTGDQVVGIGIAGGHTDQVVHNSIAITGDMDAAGATSAGTYGNAIRIANASGTSHANLTLKNNSIFMDVNTNTTTVPFFAITVNAAAYSFGTGGMNNNNLYVNLANAQMNTGGLATGSTAPTGATLFNTLAQWKTAMTVPQDAASIQADPLYLSTTGDLHIPVGSPNVGAAVDVGVTEDVDGELRDATIDIGADDPTGYKPPENDMKASAFVNPTVGSTKGAGIPFTPQASFTNLGTASQTLVPVRFRIVDSLSTEVYNNTSSIASIAGSGGTASVSFTPATIAIAGSYTMYAKAELATDTVPANDEITGALTVEAPLSGTVTVGSGGAYSSLTNDGGVFQKINSLGTTTNLTIDIVSDLTGETGTHALNEIPGAFTVLIRPVGAARAVTGSNTGGLIRLNGADNVTIDGSIGGGGTDRSLTITNTNAGTSSAVVWLQDNGTSGATSNVVENLVVVGNSNTTTLVGIGMGGATVAATSLGVGNSNDIIRNNDVSKTQIGIYSQGASASNKNTGNVITRNRINTPSPNNVSKTGIQVGFENNIQITENSVSGMALAASPDVFGIAVGISGITTSTYTGNEVTNATVARNVIGSVRNTGTFSACGICVAPTTSGTNLIANNVLTGVSSNGTFGDFGVGILVGGGAGGTTQVYYNSVSMNGTQTGGSDKSYALAIGGADPTVDVRDNVLDNTQNNGTGVNYAIGFGYATFANLTSDNNDLFVTAPSAIHAIGATASLSAPAGQATLADLRMATGKDAASISADPLFNDPASNLQPQVGSPLLTAGTPVSVTVDILGGARSLTTPTIGAYEAVGDSIGPALTCNTLGNTLSTANRTLSISASDPSGVPTSGLGLPVLYFRKGASGLFSPSTCASTGGAGYVCTLDYTLVGGVVPGDTVQYYVAAQDMVGNVSVSPAAGASGFTANPPAAATPPTAPNGYLISMALSGSYNVGSSETRTSLTNPGGIFEFINNNVLSGDVTIEITSDLATESGAVALNQFAEDGAGGYTLTIKPTGGPRVITGVGTAASTAVIKLNGADRVTIDGSVGGGTDQSLSITNTNTQSSSAVIWIASASAANGATNNTVKNTILSGQAGTTTAVGILSGSGTTYGSAAEAPNSDNTIRNNLIFRAQNALFLLGGSTNPDPGWLVTGNVFGSTTAANKLTFRGMAIQNAQGFSITKNVIQGVVTTSTSTATASGILAGGALSGGTIAGNIIHDVKQINVSGWGSNGIYLNSSSTASDIELSNNFVFDVASYGYAGDTATDNGYGIFINAGGGYRLYHNSVRLTTDQSAADGVPAALNIAVGVTAAGSLDLRNNIFATTQTVGAPYGVVCYAPNTAFSNIDFNDYWVPSGTLGYLGSADQPTLADWQTATGQDLGSVAVDPAFTSTTDLHLSCSPMSPVAGLATPLASVPVDFDNDARSATAPDMGADEVPRYSITASAGAGGSINPVGTLSAICGSSRSFTIAANPGYAIDDVLVDTASVGAVATYTFTDVQGPHTISASFRGLVGSVPGRTSFGIPLQITANAADFDHFDLSWGDSCGAAQTDFAVYEGTIGSWYSHASILGCTTGGAQSVSDVAGGDLKYYIVVPLSATAEGVYGFDSNDLPLPQGSGVCRASQDTTNCR